MLAHRVKFWEKGPGIGRQGEKPVYNRLRHQKMYAGLSITEKR
jgi:hypothetical protein